MSANDTAIKGPQSVKPLKRENQRYNNVSIVRNLVEGAILAFYFNFFFIYRIYSVHRHLCFVKEDVDISWYYFDCVIGLLSHLIKPHNSLHYKHSVYSILVKTPC